MRVIIEWQVNGRTEQTTTGTESYFDLSVPDHGDVGNTITVIVKLNDGSGDFEVYSTTVTVDNTPPVVTSIVVEGARASIYDENRGRDVHYFLVGQQAEIRVYVEDDDLSPGQGNDELRLEIFPEENLPPTVEGWTLSGYQDGYFLLTGEIAPHDNPYTDTMYYDLNICARDLYGEGDPPITLAVTNPNLKTVIVTPPAGVAGSGTQADPFIISAAAGALTFSVRFEGVGFGPTVPFPEVAGQLIRFSLWEADTLRNDPIQNDTSIDVGANIDPSGNWWAEATFTLQALPNGDIAGRDGTTGKCCEGDTKELYFRVWWYTTWWGWWYTARSPLFYVRWCP